MNELKVALTLTLLRFELLSDPTKVPVLVHRTVLKTCAATVEISVAVSQETGSQPPSGPSNSTLGNIP